MNQPNLTPAQTEVLEQTAARKTFDENGAGPWTQLYRSWRSDSGGHSLAYYSVLASPERREAYLSHLGWDARIGSGTPYIVTSSQDETETRYLRHGNDEGWEPLVILVSQDGRRDSQTILAEEFRLVFGLWEDKSTGDFISTERDGGEIVVAEVRDDSVRVRTSFLARYRALKQMDLWLYIDENRSLADLDTNADYTAHNDEWQTSRGRGYVLVRGGVIPDKVVSLFQAKKVMPPPPLKTCRLFEFENVEENYPEFVIGENEDGSPRKYSCEYKVLADYFGGNPGAPHYLTPVFFRREVLQKYFNDPHLYRLTDGYLECGGLWGMAIDNDHPDYVTVFLGDLGRDLPETERSYWVGFNITPHGEMSETSARRALLGQWVDPTQPEHRFKHAYREIGNLWNGQHGWPLYRELHNDDKLMIQRLRAPLSESQVEFEDQILLLAKLLVDYLNEKDISKAAGKGPNEEKGISKLERLLEQWNYSHVDRDIKLFRKIQDLRSKCAAHSKGSGYDRFIMGELDGRTRTQFINELLGQATQALNDLGNFTANTNG